MLGPEVDISELALEMGCSSSQASLGFWDSVTSASGLLVSTLIAVNRSFPSPRSTACWDQSFKWQACLSVTFFREGDKGEEGSHLRNYCLLALQLKSTKGTILKSDLWVPLST